ncbi:helicase-related protein [Arthrobacter sp. H14]|uniref:helicase-related protein n=1 Tax=Arthrobacter sp. H14 TaxID=1312959 RepID=UPI0004B5F30A|nr:helicase-related protein [Arthrobacter sp. H14]
MNTFDPTPALATLRGFQRRTVDHVFDRFYNDADTADRSLVADETGLGKSMVARGVIAKAIERLDQDDSGVNRIDIVYVCSNADLAKQNLGRLNVTGQTDIIESGRLTLLPIELGRLNAEPGPNTRKRVNFVSLTPGTSFNVGGATGRADERAVLFYMLAGLALFDIDDRGLPVELLRATSSVKNFKHRVYRIGQKLPDGPPADVLERFRELTEKYGHLEEFRLALKKASDDGEEAVRPSMRKIIGNLRGDLAQAGLDCLEPDLIILDEFQRFRDMLYKPGEDAEPVGEATALAREFLNYQDAKLLMLSATPYKAHTNAREEDGEDHAADFRQLLRFLSRDDDGYMASLDSALDERRKQLMGQDVAEGVTEQIESALKLYMCRTERPQLGEDDMLEKIDMSPTDVQASDISSYKAMTGVFKAAGTGNPMEYWKSVPMFAHFLTDYKIGRILDERNHGNLDAIRPLLPTLTTIDPKAYRSFGPVETDNAKFRALRKHTTGQGWWKLLWMPPSFPYLEAAGPYVEVGSEVTKQLVFSAWNASPNALTTLLSYEAERQILQDSKLHDENTAEARKRFGARLQYRVRQEDGEAQSMSTLAMFVPHATLAPLADPLTAATANGDTISGAAARESAADKIQDRLPAAVEEMGRLGLWSHYFSAPGLLPENWNGGRGRASREIRDLGNYTRSLNQGDDSDSSGGRESEAKLYQAHIERMLDTLDGPTHGWAEGLELLAMNSPGNCMYRALQRIAGPEFDQAELWKAALFGATGLRTLFNRLDVTELIDKIIPGERDYWHKVLQYCEAGNLQAVLDEYVFQLRSQQVGELTVDDLWSIADDIRQALSLNQAQLRAKYPDNSHDDLRMGVRFAVRYSNAKSDDGETNRMPDVRRAFNSPFWPFVLASTSVGQEGIDFHWWAHSVIHWNVPGNPVDFEQREGRVHRYLGHAVRKNIAEKYASGVFGSEATNPWASLLKAAEEGAAESATERANEFAPHWIHRGKHKIQRRLLDHPLSRDVPRTNHMLSGLAKYRLTLGQARQDDLQGLIKDDVNVKPLDLRP